MSGTDLPSKLLQALNDNNQRAISRCVKDDSVHQWIDNKVNHKQIQNARTVFRDTSKNITCLGYATACNDLNTVQQLVQAGADVTTTDAQGYTPLHRACVSTIESKQKVYYLLGCNPSLCGARDCDGNTPLHWAALSGIHAVISVLIQHGAKVNERGRFGRTALHSACNNGYVDCVHELMRHGANVEARDGDSEATPLQLAASFDRPDCVRVLLDTYDASINATNKYGNTALHRAASAGNLKVVKLLTSYSQIDVHARNSVYETAADVAEEKGHLDIVNYLTPQRSLSRATTSLTEPQRSVSRATTSLTESNITDDKKVYSMYIYSYI